MFTQVLATNYTHVAVFILSYISNVSDSEMLDPVNFTVFSSFKEESKVENMLIYPDGTTTIGTCT